MPEIFSAAFLSALFAIVLIDLVLAGDNAIVVGDDGVLNPGGLRFTDEFVRHKVLDALGDLVTLGRPLLGHVVLFKAGHDVMNKLVKKILESSVSHRSVELGAGWVSDQAMNFAQALDDGSGRR